jgi:hypothetical protein
MGKLLDNQWFDFILQEIFIQHLKKCGRKPNNRIHKDARNLAACDAGRYSFETKN